MMDGGRETLALVAPGFAVAPDIWSKTVDGLRSRNYGVKTFGQNQPAHWRFAGDDHSRAQYLMQAYLDTSVDAILCMRGGSGCSRLLSHLDFFAIARHPKPLIGYSDVTALQMALSTLTDSQMVHGPMGLDLVGEDADHSFKALAQALSADFDVDLGPDDGVHIAQVGSFAGPLIGGNLTVFLSLIGTPEFHVPDHSVLFFEDVGEHDFRLDRALVHLSRSGILQKCGALLFGRTLLADSDDPSDFRRLAMTHLGDFLGPIVFDLPSGHGCMKLALPIGRFCQVRADTQSVSLQFGSATAANSRTRIAV